METVAKNIWKDLIARAKSGDARAQWEVGHYHEYGAVDESGKILVKTDPRKAQHWYQLSAGQGYDQGQVALSNLLSSGGVARDYETAIYWAKKAIAQGNANAAYNLGTIYRDQNKPAMAFRCYERAASMGDKDALLDIGLCCLFGFGTKQDFGAAYRRLKEITNSEPGTFCQRTGENALYWMAVLNLIGIGNRKRSVADARRMLESANADDDHEQANALLNLIGKSRYLRA